MKSGSILRFAQLIIILCLIGCSSTKLAWKNYVVSEGGKQHLIQYGKDKSYDEILFVSFSPDSSRIAYAAKRGVDNYIIIDGIENEMTYQGIQLANPIFSPDGKRIAYGAKIAGKWFVVVDNEAGFECDSIRKYTPLFSPDGNRVVYLAQFYNRWWVVLDGKIVEEFKQVSWGWYSQSAHVEFDKYFNYKHIPESPILVSNRPIYINQVNDKDASILVLDPEIRLKVGNNKIQAFYSSSGAKREVEGTSGVWDLNIEAKPCQIYGTSWAAKKGSWSETFLSDYRGEIDLWIKEITPRNRNTKYQDENAMLLCNLEYFISILEDTTETPDKKSTAIWRMKEMAKNNASRYDRIIPLLINQLSNTLPVPSEETKETKKHWEVYSGKSGDWVLTIFTLADEARMALEELTKHSFGMNKEEWSNWWQKTAK